MQIIVNVSDIVKQYRGQSTMLKKSNRIIIDGYEIDFKREGNSYKFYQYFKALKETKVKDINLKFNHDKKEIHLFKDNINAVFYCL